MGIARPALRDRSRPALVVDGNSRADLGTIRSLGGAGVPVVLLSPHRRSIPASSRFVSRTLPFPPPDAPAAERVARLREVAGSLDRRPVIFATGDRVLNFLSESRGEWEDLIDHDFAPAEVVRTCADKSRFASRGRELGLPIPETFLPASAAEVPGRTSSMRFPVFVKPLDRADWARLPAGTVKQAKGQSVGSADELCRLFEVLERHGSHRAVIQEMVVGPDEEHTTALVYMAPDGTVLASFCGVKVRIWPAHAGLGALVQSRVVPGVIETAVRALRAFGYSGFADVDFKRDVRTGEQRMLEINCRYSTWVELAARSGCNLPATGYAHVTGQPVTSGRQVEGASWLDLHRDRQAMADYRREGEWPMGAYARSLARVRHGAFFALDDLAPWVKQTILRTAG